MKQHRGNRFKNMESKGHEGTRGIYARRLWKFNNWITNKEVTFTKIYPPGKDTFEQKNLTKKSIKSERLSARLAQDIRNPLDVIKNTLYLLEFSSKNDS